MSEREADHDLRKLLKVLDYSNIGSPESSLNYKDLQVNDSSSFIASAEEETALFQGYYAGNKKCRDKIINSHLRFVIKIARGFSGYKLSSEDLISEGNLGLIRAFDKFDISKGFRFSTYAKWWIEAFMQNYILSNWSMVKLGTTVAQKKLFFNLRRCKMQLEIYDDRNFSEESIEIIANKLQVNKKDVESMNARMKSRDDSINVLQNKDSFVEYQDLMSDDNAFKEENIIEAEQSRVFREFLYEAVSLLKERDRDIFIKRRVSDPINTLKDLSMQYNLSKERVRQIELNSFKVVANYIRSKSGNAFG